MQLNHPYGLFVDHEEKVIYIADAENHRIVAWRSGDERGRVVIGHYGAGSGLNQLNWPTDVVVDRRTNSLIVCDYRNRRIVRWSRENPTSGEILIANMACGGLALDHDGNLYVIDIAQHEVKRFPRGQSQGVVVAGGHGSGSRLDQLSSPRYIFVDQAQSVFVSDYRNHRVVKWMRSAREGTVVAGGNGQGKTLRQLSSPQGLYVDSIGNIYVADSWNHRIVRWSRGQPEGALIVEGKGKENKPHQLFGPTGISFDRDGNLYVMDPRRHQVQRFAIETTECSLS